MGQEYFKTLKPQPRGRPQERPPPTPQPVQQPARVVSAAPPEDVSVSRSTPLLTNGSAAEPNSCTQYNYQQHTQPVARQYKVSYPRCSRHTYICIATSPGRVDR